MARMVHCIKLDKEAEGLDFPPYPGEMGKKIWDEEFFSRYTKNHLQ